MTDPQLHELLPWFMTGTLDSREKADFASHLEGCAACRAEIELLEGIRRQTAEHGAAVLVDHPSTDALVGTVLGEISGTQAETVRRHLALCPDCALESRWAKDEAVAGGGVATGSSPVTRSNPLANPLWGWVAAAAAVIALGVVLPRGDGPEPRIGIVTPVLVTETVRSAESGSVVEINRTENQNPTFLVDSPPDGYPLLVTITDADGTVHYTESGVSEEMTPGGSLQLDVGTLPLGEYSVRVASESNDEPPFEFRFRLFDD